MERIMPDECPVVVIALASGGRDPIDFVLVDATDDCAFGPVLRDTDCVEVRAFGAFLGRDPRSYTKPQLTAAWAQFRASKETSP